MERPFRPVRSVHAITLTDVHALRIDPQAMLRLIHTDNNACDFIISPLISLQTRVIENCADILLYSSNIRLAHAGSSIAQLYQDPEVGPVPKLSQQDLANMIGVTRQRVNAILKRSNK